MTSEQSIYPIKQLYFECTGCKTRWMLRVDPPIRNIEDFKSFTTDPKRMEPCPMLCGSTTCNIALRITSPIDSDVHVDPFEIFDKTDKASE